MSVHQERVSLREACAIAANCDEVYTHGEALWQSVGAIKAPSLNTHSTPSILLDDLHSKASLFALTLESPSS